MHIKMLTYTAENDRKTCDILLFRSVNKMYLPSSYTAPSRQVTDEDAGFLRHQLGEVSHFTGFERVLAP